MVSFEWDPGALKKLEREVANNLDDLMERAVTQTVCPDHHKAARLTGDEAGWRIEACCDKAADLARRNVSRALK